MLRFSLIDEDFDNNFDLSLTLTLKVDTISDFVSSTLKRLILGILILTNAALGRELFLFVNYVDIYL